MKRIIALTLSVFVGLAFLTSCSSTEEKENDAVKNDDLTSAVAYTDIKNNEFVLCAENERISGACGSDEQIPQRSPTEEDDYRSTKGLRGYCHRYSQSPFR